tara:strand:- start:145 stop:684 length:540 start_codon:yes stop_codon:yes gene_type:complete
MENLLNPIFKTTLFPQNLVVFKYPNNLNLLINNLLQIKNTIPNSIKGYPPELIYQTTNHLFKEYSVYNDLEKFIFSLTQSYFKTSFKMINSWGNIYSKYSKSNPHTHPDSNLVGIFYLKVPDKCGDLLLHNKFKTEETYRIKPQEGLIFIIDKDQLHSTDLNLNDSPKISIAFNLGIIK